MNRMIKVEVLYPEFCNLFGDDFNARYLEMCDDSIELIRTNLNSEPYFVKNDDVRMIIMGAMTEDGQELCLEKLKPHKERIEELINKDVVFLLTGNSLELFGKSIENEDGSSIECLNIFGTVAKRNMLDRHNSLFIGEFEDIDVVGFKSQFAHSYGNIDDIGAFKKKGGVGFSPESNYEGVRIHNFFATYLLGPILVMNPLFTKKIMELLGIKNPHVKYEDVSLKAYNKRVEEFKIYADIPRAH